MKDIIEVFTMQKNYTIKQETIKNQIRFIVTSNKDYFVTINPEFRCTCADFRFRKEKTGEFCKHIQAVIDSLEVKP
jgi:predicted nucleic acid-binding Zn finger protein